jgi:hypothetical protein
VASLSILVSRFLMVYPLFRLPSLFQLSKKRFFDTSMEREATSIFPRSPYVIVLQYTKPKLYFNIEQVIVSKKYRKMKSEPILVQQLPWQVLLSQVLKPK